MRDVHSGLLNTSAHVVLAQMLLFTSLFAQPGVLQAAEVSSDQGRRSYEKGVALFREGDADGAIEALKKSLQQNPSQPEAYHLLGLVYFNGKRNPDEAVQAFNQSLKLNPRSAEVLNHLADVYLAQGKSSEAEGVL
ncbi:MAG TPA: tetratricopeptide repeat protein, partial [Nitrospiraceae bacterium]|nr:tetratricopeptide repeat protein [Nitrospiraceae bacterium]